MIPPRRAVVLAAVVILILVGAPVAAQALRPAGVRLPFIEGGGTHATDASYHLRAGGRTVLFEPGCVTFVIGDARVRVRFGDRDAPVDPVGEARASGVVSYFVGPRARWRTGLRTFEQIRYRGVWPGIDVVYTATRGALKYAFHVAPGGDPRAIRLHCEGGVPAVAPDGGLVIDTPAGAIEDAAPIAWQDDATRTPVDVRFDRDALDDGVVAFLVGAFDRALPLVVDPAIVLASGYLGGGGSDDAMDVAVDAAGSIYATGGTASSATFPVATGPSTAYGGGFGDAFVAKLDPTGQSLVYCGFIGGSLNEYGRSIAVDAAGAAYIVGSTWSTPQTFPVLVGPGLQYGGNGDAFVAKIAPSGIALVFCGYIGGTNRDHAIGVAVDSARQVYVGGSTRSTEASFPVVVGPDLTFNTVFGGYDGFVARVHANGSGLGYCGYIGGQSECRATDIAVDASGAAFVTGYTLSDETTFPVTVGPDVTYNGGLGDAFVARVNTSGASLDYCGYIGGAAHEYAFASVAVDAQGQAYVVGLTASDETTFPVTVGPDLTFNGGTIDAFAAKVRADGTGLVYCGYVGGASNEAVAGRSGTEFSTPSIAIDRHGSAILVAGTTSDEQTFPVTRATLSGTYGGPAPSRAVVSGDGFLAAIDPSGARLTACGYLGGGDVDCALGVALDPTGNAIVVGYTRSATFPTAGGLDATYNGAGDGFVTRIALTTLGATAPARVGQSVPLVLTASDDAGRAYRMGASLGTGPIPIGAGRALELSPDPLLGASAGGSLPGIFRGFAGTISAQGDATASIAVPPIAALVGVRVYTAFITLDPASPLGIRGASNRVALTVVP